jgi:predicted HTH transcriptional regulator
MYNEKLDPLEESIINLIRENDSITVKEMVKVLNISEKTIKRRIAELKNANKLNRKGSKKTGKWVINDLCKDTVPICLKVSQNMGSNEKVG